MMAGLEFSGIELTIEDLEAKAKSLTEKESADVLGGRRRSRRHRRRRRRRSNRRAHRGSNRVYRGVSRATVGNVAVGAGKMGVRKDQDLPRPRRRRRRRRR